MSACSIPKKRFSFCPDREIGTTSVTSSQAHKADPPPNTLWGKKIRGRSAPLPGCPMNRVAKLALALSYPVDVVQGAQTMQYREVRIEQR